MESLARNNAILTNIFMCHLFDCNFNGKVSNEVIFYWSDSKEVDSYKDLFKTNKLYGIYKMFISSKVNP